MKQIAYVKRPFIWSFLVLLFCLTLPVNASEKSPQEIDLTKNTKSKLLKNSYRKSNPKARIVSLMSRD